MLVENGVQLQLLAYLDALRHWKNPQEIFGVDQADSRRSFLRQPARRIQKRRLARRKFWRMRTNRAAWRIATREDLMRASLDKLDRDRARRINSIIG